MTDVWVSIAVFVAYCAAVCAVVVRQKVLDRRRHRRAAERRLLAFKARRSRMAMDWDDLLREGEPDSDELFDPPYYADGVGADDEALAQEALNEMGVYDFSVRV